MKYILIFFISALIPSIGDINHLATSTAVYPIQGLRLFTLPWWVPLQFACAGLTLFALFKKFVPAQKTSLLKLSLIVVFFLGSYLLSGSLPPSLGLIKFTLLLGLTLIAVFLFPLNKMAFLISLFAVVFGCSWEAILGKLQVFVYTTPEIKLFGIPLWLPLLYLLASLTLREVHNFFNPLDSK